MLGWRGRLLCGSSPNSLAAHFVFPLKPIRATCFNNREGGVLGQVFSFLSWSSGAGQRFFERAEKRLAACRFSLEQKNKGLAVFILEQKIGIAGAVFLEQKTEAAWLDLYSRFG